MLRQWAASRCGLNRSFREIWHLRARFRLILSRRVKVFRQHYASIRNRLKQAVDWEQDRVQYRVQDRVKK